MKHLNIAVESIGQLAEFFGSEATRSAVMHARSILVQIYVGRLDHHWIANIVETTQTAMPQAIVVGATSAGEISQGRVALESTVLSFSFFESSHLQSIAVACSPGNEYAVGKAMAEALRSVTDLQGIFLLASPTRMNCARVLEGIDEILPQTPVFGGGAADILPAKQPRVFHHADFYESGCVAVALAGKELHIDTHISLGWKAIGPRMTLTDVDGFNIRTIDGNPAVDIYRRYLGIDQNDDDMYLIEFPLLLERRDAQLARNPVSANEAGCVTLVADVYPGETARLGYLDVDSVTDKMSEALRSLKTFAPEAIFLYSCICRRFTLQEDVECETRPFQDAAPVAGFFTSGEFVRNEGNLQLLNSSQVIVAMREGAAVPQTARPNADIHVESDRYRFRHARITSRLFDFITALTEELAQANHQLQYQAQHDAMTGAFNRRALDTNLDDEFSRSVRYGRSLSVVMFDLDHFKRFNDEYGHAAGDHVLKSMVTAIEREMRSSDTLYRYGGEEFVLMLPETALAAAISVAEKIRAAVEAMVLFHEAGKLPVVTISLGVACYPEHGNSCLPLLKAADVALYQSKENGRNRVSAAL